MYSIGVTRDSEGVLTLSLHMETQEYTDEELNHSISNSVTQIGPGIRNQVVYIDKTLDTSLAMDVGFTLMRSYGCDSYVWNPATEKYVRLEF